MTKITIDRALVEQALETIEGLTRDRLFTAEWARVHGATIAALRAALTEPVEPVPQPGVWMHPWPPVKAQQAEPVQEPDHTYKLIGCVQHDCEECQRRTQRKPLTDEEIVRIFETPELAGTHFQTPTIKAIAVARAIERAHGIKGGV